MMAGGMMSMCCMMNGMMMCQCNMAMCKCECTMTKDGVCMTCTSGDKACAKCSRPVAIACACA